jgi:hypothetical protein
MGDENSRQLCGKTHCPTWPYIYSITYVNSDNETFFIENIQSLQYIQETVRILIDEGYNSITVEKY